MDFAAIDFETANRFHGSVCAVGLVIVERGQVIEKVSRLVRPKDLVFDPFNIKIHGITEEHVRNELEFHELWPEILPLLEKRILIAHNASFDMSVLRSVLAQYGLPCPGYPHACTVRIARRTWPELPSHRLNVVADHLGIEFQHHDALEDAFACAQIAIKACEIHKTNTLYELAEKLGIGIGSMNDPVYRGQDYRRASWYPNPKDITPETDDFDSEHPFFCAPCVFTGYLKSMSRREAMQRVVNSGGQCTNNITKKTRYLIVGDPDFRVKGGKSSKMKKAEQLIKEGLGIEILNEEEFLRLLQGASVEAI